MSAPVPPGLYTEPPRGASAFPPVPAPQASDPTVLSTGQVIPRHGMSLPPDGGSFSVDLANAPRVLADLRQARSELLEIRREALALGKLDPGTRDQVSLDAVSVFETVAVGGTGSLLAAVEAGVGRIDEIMTALETELREYRAVESDLSSRFDART